MTTPDSGLPLRIEEIRALYAGDAAHHDFQHVLRVYHLAEGIAATEGARLDIVRMAALLHDAGLRAGRPNHHVRGAAIARELLQGQPSDYIDAVAHAIEAHRFRSEPAPQTLEARVLSDADKLDAIGAIGIARAFAYAGAHGADLWQTHWREIAANKDGAAEGPTVLGRAYTPVHEFVYKLMRIPERLFTGSAREIAVERIEFMTSFFDRLDLEARGEG